MTAREAWDQDFPGKSPEHPAWLGFYNIYAKGYEAGQRASTLTMKFDAALVPQPTARERVRRYDGATSFEAALSISPEKTKRLYEDIYNALSAAPMTDETLVQSLLAYGTYSPSGIRSRRHELVEAGWVWSTDSATMSTGRRARVWKAFA